MTFSTPRTPIYRRRRSSSSPGATRSTPASLSSVWRATCLVRLAHIALIVAKLMPDRRASSLCDIFFASSTSLTRNRVVMLASYRYIASLTNV
jgi:hypothetical protein